LQVGAFLHEPLTGFAHSPAVALHVWRLRLPQACATCGPVCGHEALVGSHQMMFSFS
jgi:hypothetical protein